jgi:hypothetical protein
MKKLFTILAMLVAMCVNAQWSSDIRLTNAAGDSYMPYNSARNIATSGDTIHITWWDTRDEYSEIYYKRSTNNGTNWEADVRLTNVPGFSGYPCISASGLNLHVVWMDQRTGFYGIFYKKSTNGGLTWGNDIRIAKDSTTNWDPFVLVSANNVYAVWENWISPTNMSIHYTKSTDNGTTWSTETKLTDSSAQQLFPSLSISGTTIHLIWQDTRDGNTEIYYKRSTNNGINWGIDTRLTNNAGASGNPLGASIGLNVYVVWDDNRDGNWEIYFKHSTDAGITWGSDIRLTDTTGDSGWPSIAVAPPFIHVTWEDQRDGNREIYYRRSINNGQNWDPYIRQTNNTSMSRLPSIAVSSSFVHIIWQDGRDGNGEIYYKRNPTGNIIDIVNPNSEISGSYSLSQNYPNPFNPITNFKFSMLNAGNAKIVVYDIQGREVQTLVNERLQPGTYETSFDGSMLNSGVYFYKLVTDGFTETKKMLLIK